jgi:hypothetical protein
MKTGDTTEVTDAFTYLGTCITKHKVEGKHWPKAHTTPLLPVIKSRAVHKQNEIKLDDS